MSLKAFHLIFIVLATLVSAGCAVWAFQNNAGNIFGFACVVVAIALVIYGFLFVRKSKDLIL